MKIFTTTILLLSIATSRILKVEDLSPESQQHHEKTQNHYEAIFTQALRYLDTFYTMKNYTFGEHYMNMSWNHGETPQIHYRFNLDFSNTTCEFDFEIDSFLQNVYESLLSQEGEQFQE